MERSWWDDAFGDLEALSEVRKVFSYYVFSLSSPSGISIM